MNTFVESADGLQCVCSPGFTLDPVNDTCFRGECHCERVWAPLPSPHPDSVCYDYEAGIMLRLNCIPAIMFRNVFLNAYKTMDFYVSVVVYLK